MVLTTEGDPVSHVVYLISGEVEILVSGVVVATCGAGNFVGEMSIVGNAPASATATVSRPARFWRIETGKLQVLQETDPEIAGALNVGIAKDLRNKIISLNTSRSGESFA